MLFLTINNLRGLRPLYKTKHDIVTFYYKKTCYHVAVTGDTGYEFRKSKEEKLFLTYPPSLISTITKTLPFM